jgi:PAS domain S-box-containing protein
MTHQSDPNHDNTQADSLSYQEISNAKTILMPSNAEMSALSTADLQNLLAQCQQQNLYLAQQNEALRKSRDDYALIYNYSGVGYLTLNATGHIQNANLTAEKILGCIKGDLLNKNLDDFIYPADLKNYHAFIAVAAKQQTSQILTFRLNKPIQAVHRPRKPKLAPLSPSAKNTAPYDAFTYIECQHAFNKTQAGSLDVFLTINDITEHKYAQERINYLNEHLNRKILEQSGELIASSQKLLKKVAELNQSKHLLQEREARLHSIFNAAVEGIITINAAGNIVAVNASVTSIFGYSQEDLVGHSIIKLMPWTQTKHYHHYLKKYLKLHIPRIVGKIIEIEGAHKNGTLIPIDLSVSEFSLEGESYVTGIVRDVTLRKEQERHDKALLDELAHVTRLGLMGEMASGIAHEVNQPLSAIASYTQACLNFMQNGQPDLAQLGNIMLKVQQQALNAGQIIHRMRDFVKFKTLHRSTVDINDLVQICIDLCVADLKHNGVAQRFELANNLPLVSVDSVQIEQVLINLIRNGIEALKNLPPATRRQLSIQTRLNSEQAIEVRVKDNGPGIEDVDQKKILTPFFTTKSDGMGMGLSISHSIIKAHEGILYFNSKVGKGTTFYFTLPIRKKS